jgi:hypothetical protein
LGLGTSLIKANDSWLVSRDVLALQAGGNRPTKLWNAIVFGDLFRSVLSLILQHVIVRPDLEGWFRRYRVALQSSSLLDDMS